MHWWSFPAPRVSPTVARTWVRIPPVPPRHLAAATDGGGANLVAGDRLQMLRVMRTHWKQNGGLAGLWWVLCGLKHYLCGGPFGPSQILLAGSINLCWVVFFWQGRLSSCCCCCRRSLTQLSNAFTELAFTIKMIRSHIYLLHQILRSFMTII